MTVSTKIVVYYHNTTFLVTIEAKILVLAYLFCFSFERKVMVLVEFLLLIVQHFSEELAVGLHNCVC